MNDTSLENENDHHNEDDGGDYEYEGYTPLNDTPYTSLMSVAVSNNDANGNSEGMFMFAEYDPTGTSAFMDQEDGDGDGNNGDNGNDDYDFEFEDEGGSEGIFYATNPGDVFPVQVENKEETKIDYLEIANQALANLDNDYQSTLTREETETGAGAGGSETSNQFPNRSPSNNEGADPDPLPTTPAAGVGTSSSDESTTQSKLESGEAKLSTLTSDTTKEDVVNAKLSPPLPNNELKPNDVPDLFASTTTTTTTTTTTIAESKKIVPNIDTDAISRAVKNIRLKAPSLTATLDNWKPTSTSTSSTTTVSSIDVPPPPSQHDIIPSMPLTAFRRTTTKAIHATANLSRSATMAEALVRIFHDSSSPQQPTTEIDTNTRSSSTPKKMEERKSSNAPFVIHVIGADHVECKTKETLLKAVGPFVRWLNTARQRQTKDGSSSSAPPQFLTEMSSHLLIEMLGPNVPMDAVKRPPLDLLDSILPKCSSDGDGFQSASLVCKNCVYHDYLMDLMTTKGDDKKISSSRQDYFPDFVIAFNAGIWGYNEWIPTLKQMALFEERFPFVITGYTVQEVEDDFDVLEGVIDELPDTDKSDFIKERCLWSAEVNPFGSRKLRETATSPHGRKYYENGGWQAWLMGR